MPWIVAAVMVLAVTGQAALAQSDDGIDPSAVVRINADRVDGRHAIKSTGNAALRKGRLMAFSAAGYLPSNIVQGGVATLAALRSTTGAVNEADNPVHWNQLFGVPPAVVAGDTTRSFIAAESAPLAVNDTSSFFVDQPIGLDVEWALIPTAVGQTVYVFDNPIVGASEGFQRIDAGTLRHWILFKNFNVVSTVKVRVTVWNDSFLAPAAARNKVKVTFIDPKKALKELGIK
ncbi:MAG TPA: hypothetical protein VFF55_07095 [Candidatus Deferrimicrobium sp.]|nr:hypothetical protein [Candidatus Deferrimicrobium sp.]